MLIKLLGKYMFDMIVSVTILFNEVLPVLCNSWSFWLAAALCLIMVLVSIIRTHLQRSLINQVTELNCWYYHGLSCFFSEFCNSESSFSWHERTSLFDVALKHNSSRIADSEPDTKIRFSFRSKIDINSTEPFC